MRASSRMSHYGLILTLLAVTTAVPIDYLWPHGEELDQFLPPGQDEVSSPEFPLKVPIVFYDEAYDSIYVNSNGLLSFRTDIPSFFNIQFPLDYPVIAPLYTDVDTRGTGVVYYRETQDEYLLHKANNLIRESFSSSPDFTATSLFIATWKEVGYYNKGSDKVNTYQVIIVSDGKSSYVELIYPEGGIQWVQGTGKSTSLPDARAQAGFISGDGRLHTLRGSGTHQIQNLDKWSNTGTPGKWLYHVGNTGPSGNIMEADIGNSVAPVSESAPETCAEGGTVCHNKASCVDYSPGFCCECSSGYYGNGLNCLKDEIPLRVNGKVSGTVNGISLSDMDLQAYVVTSDGRTYTAISRMPEGVGFDIQVLNIIGGVIGWMFAKPLNEAKNGFELTGGNFNYTADISFPNSGEHVTIHQYYNGFDVFDQLRMEAHIFGNLPSIPRHTKIEMSDYEEKFTRTSPGIIQAYSTRKFHLEGVKIDNPFNTHHVITYHECVANPQNVTTQLVKVARNFITYDAREKIIRYAMTNKVSPPGDIDPCREGKKTCGDHSSCVVEGDNFRCICNPGYQLIYSSFDASQQSNCVDENECLIGSHKCDKNAACFNHDGGYHCQCNPGYRGDGRNCEKVETCEDINCDPNAECIEIPLRKPECRCHPGYKGNGHQCIAVTQDVGCDVIDNCSQFGACSYNEIAEQYLCSCLPGFIGDGIYCRDASKYNSSSGPPLPTCLLGYCWCPDGYDFDGRDGCLEKPVIEDSRENPEDAENYPEPACIDNTCICPKGYVLTPDKYMCRPRIGADLSSHGTKGVTGFKLSCNTVNTCHPNAQCIYVTPAGNYQCQCNAGYEGDGHECVETDISCADVDICDLHATCTYDDLLQRSVCVCNPGYQGDGGRCYAVDECRFSYDCGENAQCLYNKETQRHECVCSLGFLGDGRSCHPNEDTAECTTHADCHPDAACIYDTGRQSFVCRCNPNFSGDGKICSAATISCHVLNNCGPNADCMYDIQESGYRCKCQEGYEGDGFTCQKDASCQHDATVCHEKASCIPSRGTYFCQCNEGYVGNGLHCKATSRHEGNFLLVNQGMATLRVPFYPTISNPGQPIQIHYFQIAIGIDIDCQEGRVYWSDINGKTIKSSKYDGSDIQIFLDTDIGSPEGLSIDWVSRNIYWTDSTKDTVEVANLETKIRKVLISDGLVNPRGIVVHPAKGKMYFTDWNRENPKIETANLDGSHRSIFLQGSVQLPNSLAFDYDRDELCWSDAGSKKIECMGVYSLVRRTVMSNCSYPFGLTMSSRNYYWTDWITQKIESSPRPEGELNKPIDVPLGGSGKIYGIVAVPEQCPQMYNICQYESSPCPEDHLCLPNGRGGRSCVCGIKNGAETSTCNDGL